MNTSRNLFTLFCSRVGSPNPIRFQVLHSWSRDLHLSSHHEAPIGRLGSKVPIGGASSARVHGTYSLPFRRDREWAIYKLKLYISGLKPKSIETLRFARRIPLAITSIAIVWIYWCSKNAAREYKTRKSFDKGAVPGPADFFLGRKELEIELKSILQPPLTCSDYDLVVGRQGTGKSTLVCKVANECKGIIYVHIPGEIEKVDKAFADALNFSLSVDGSRAEAIVTGLTKLEQPKQTEGTLFDWVFAMFTKNAGEFKKNEKKLPVLVFDNIRCDAESDRKHLQILKNIAKNGVDKREFKTIFVVNEEDKEVLELLGQQSGTGKKFTIGDLSKGEAKDYLCGYRKLLEDDAKKIYELVGGRIKLLVAAADVCIPESKLFPAWESSMIIYASKTFDKANMAVTGENRTVGLKVARCILESGSLTMHDYYLLVGNIELARHLLTLNIFSADPSTNRIVFDSKLIANYAKGEVEKEEAAVGEAAKGRSR